MSTPLDPRRQERAAERARMAAAEQAHHERQAESARSIVRQLCHMWHLDPVTFEPLVD